MTTIKESRLDCVNRESPVDKTYKEFGCILWKAKDPEMFRIAVFDNIIEANKYDTYTRTNEIAYVNGCLVQLWVSDVKIMAPIWVKVKHLTGYNKMIDPPKTKE